MSSILQLADEMIIFCIRIQVFNCTVMDKTLVYGQNIVIKYMFNCFLAMQSSIVEKHTIRWTSHLNTIHVFPTIPLVYGVHQKIIVRHCAKSTSVTQLKKQFNYSVLNWSYYLGDEVLHVNLMARASPPLLSMQLQTVKFVAKSSKCAGLAQEIGFSAPNLCSLLRVKGATQLCTSKKSVINWT